MKRVLVSQNRDEDSYFDISDELFEELKSYLAPGMNCTLDGDGIPGELLDAVLDSSEIQNYWDLEIRMV